MQRVSLGPLLPQSSAHRRRAAPPARLLHRLPSLNRVVPQHPPASHRLRRAGRNVAVGPDGYPLRVDPRRVGLEVTELLLLLGIQPPFTTSLLWRLVEAAVPVVNSDGLTKPLACLPHKTSTSQCLKKQPLLSVGLTNSR